MQPKRSDIEANDEPDHHDQLPSVEEAKINLDASQILNQQTPTKTIRYVICVALAAALVLALLLTAVLLSSLRKDVLQVPDSDPGIPSDIFLPETQPEPEDSRYTQIKEVLKSVSDGSDLATQGSPQYLAASWIAHEDSLQVSPSQPENLIQRYVLALMYFTLGKNNEWQKNLGFLSGKDECTWNIAEPSAVVTDIKAAGVLCNDKGKVTQLDFPPGYVTGTLPDEMRFLSDVEKIGFGKSRDVTGTFPPFLQFLSNLNHLELNHCGFSGTLPDWLGSLTALQTLILSNNGFTGDLPQGIAALTNLEYLYLDDNKLSGDIDSFGALTDMKHLVLEDNSFTGQITANMIDNLSKLEVLDVSENQIGSKLPSNIWSLKELQVFDVHGNLFQGEIPGAEEIHTKLTLISMNNNKFSGHLPTSISRFIKLQHLDLSNNVLASALPQSLAELTDLEYFFVANNPFEADIIPSFLSNLTNLKDLSLKATNRIGGIPEWMGSMQLALLDLDSNAVSGTIPAALGKITTLEHLLLNRNKLEGNVPESLSKLSNLGTLLLDNNRLIGSMEHVCASNHARVLTADCAGSSPEVTCECCTVCCEAGDDSCNNASWLGNINPIWENAHQRGVYYDFKHLP